MADAVIGILVEQSLQHFTGAFTVFMEYVALLDILGTLTARQWFLAIGDVTDEVEIIDITHALVFFQSL